jgi:hypothetical protein
MSWRGSHEGWIESVQSIGGCVEVTLSLADGSLARSTLEWEQADWLELRVGQIVKLAPRSPGDPRRPVVCQGLDVGWEVIGGHVG